jgi:hypothetical protein
LQEDIEQVEAMTEIAAIPVAEEDGIRRVRVWEIPAVEARAVARLEEDIFDRTV